LYGNPGAETNELKKFERKQHDTSHEAEDAVVFFQ
jgi:hypothetical protein